MGVLSSDNLTLSDVRKIKHIQGPVLYLKEKDGQLFCGTNAETYLLSDRKAQSLSVGSAGGSCLAEGIINGKDVLIEGTYTKLYQFFNSLPLMGKQFIVQYHLSSPR